MRTSRFFSFNVFVLMLSIIMFSCNREGRTDYSEADVKTVKKLTNTHISFIVSFYPGVVEANQKVLDQRDKVLDYKSDYPGAINRSRKLKGLNNIADEYRLTDSLFTEDLTKEEFAERIDELLLRVDIIPEKLVMAQAIIESGWGDSKYAKSINNYFGIHCYKPGCGEPPSEVENPKFWVKSFPSIEACVEEYIWNLNIGHAYDDLRNVRLKLHKENNFPNAVEMAKGLEKYSEKGNEYINLVQSIIKNYLPSDLDAFVDYHERNTSE